MDTAVNCCEELEKKISTYYPECKAVQSGEELLIELPIGKIKVRGCHGSFFAFGEPFGELDFKDENELYQGIETYILAMQNEEKKCNPTFITACKNAEKYSRMTLYLGVAAFVLSILSYYLFELPGIFLLVSLLMPIVSVVALRFVRLYCLSRDWVCPCCGAKLPLETSGWLAQPKAVTRCPACGQEMLEHALVEQLRQQNFPQDKEEPHQQEKSPKEPPAKPAQLRTKQPKSRGRRSCSIWGILLLLYALFFTSLMFVDIEKVPPAVTAVNAAALLLTSAAGSALLHCNAPKQQQTKTPNILVCERKWLPAVGIGLGLFGMLFLFFSFVYSSVTPVSFGMVALFTILGLSFIGMSAWMLLARKNRSLSIYNKQLVYTTSFGKVQEIKLEKIGSVRVTAKGSIEFRDKNAQKLFSIESNMAGAVQVIDWIEEQNFELGVTKAMEKKMDRKSAGTLSWHKEDRTPLHDHLKEIRACLMVVLLLLAAGSVVPFFLYLTTDLKMSRVIYLTAFSPLPMVLFFIAFAPVLLVGDYPAGATDEWKTMHIKFPMMPVMILDLLIFAQIYHFWEERVLQIVDFGRFFLLEAGVTALLIALCWLRTPKRLRTQEFAMMILSLVLLGFVLTYGVNLAISSPAEHYPAVIVDQHEPTNQAKDADHTFTVQLEDGTLQTLNVSKQLYDLQKEGFRLVVCQKENSLGIRMARLHLPEGTDITSLPKTEPAS